MTQRGVTKDLTASLSTPDRAGDAGRELALTAAEAIAAQLAAVTADHERVRALERRLLAARPRAAEAAPPRQFRRSLVGP